MTRNNKKANDATRVRRMETFAKRVADNDQKPTEKLSAPTEAATVANLTASE